ncbi:galactoside O-acetyltransferase [Oenococcus oeni]|uniref:acyltransferase n=1 Tax=Oenococcus oeni TaxID=1247 RepID=UPI0008F84D62|nr:DapH/DapD/GlmU-related protein [Oenococcus oeni]OIK85862.1 galactoside O-acetyltransferase [Oenococcus oeni]OIL08055.1 galactoside O-acetyltransferase [Oenococcus oeni]OIL11216.1 galactoside O-acetyltransferase [Oenococcus oeni]
MNNNLSFLQKLNIFRETGSKIIRGFWNRIFLKESNGLLFIGRKVSMHNRRHIKVGKNVKFEALCEIQGLSTHGVIFGNNVTIGYGTQIRPSSYYGVGKIGYGLMVGNNSSIGPMGFIGCAGQIKIGDNVMIGPNVSIIAENHNFNKLDKSIKKQGVYQKGIVIEDNVWIGTNVIILDGVIVKKGSVVGAGTLLTKDVSKNSINYDKRQKIVRER